MYYDRKNANKKVVRRNVTMTQGQEDALRFMKEETGINMSNAIRIAVDEYLEKRLPGGAES